MGAEQSLEQQADPNASPFSRLMPKSGTTPAGGVVVVSGPNATSSFGQTEIDKLAKIPLFSPFIKSSVNLFGFDSNSIDGSSSTLAASSPSSGLGQTPPMLDSRALAAISTRLQEHLRQCAEAVAFDQNALCNRMSEIDMSIAAAHSCLSERHRRYTRLCEQLSQTKDMCALASKVKAGVEQTHRGLAELNNLLPADLKLPIPDFNVPAVHDEGNNNSNRSSRAVSNSNSIEVANRRSLFDNIASSTSSNASLHLQQGDAERPPSGSKTESIPSGNEPSESATPATTATTTSHVDEDAAAEQASSNATAS